MQLLTGEQHGLVFCACAPNLAASSGGLESGKKSKNEYSLYG